MNQQMSVQLFLLLEGLVTFGTDNFVFEVILQVSFKASFIAETLSTLMTLEDLSLLVFQEMFG